MTLFLGLVIACALFHVCWVFWLTSALVSVRKRVDWLADEVRLARTRLDDIEDKDYDGLASILDPDGDRTCACCDGTEHEKLCRLAKNCREAYEQMTRQGEAQVPKPGESSPSE